MGAISLENANRLLWLGRYTERVYTTIRFFSEHFDRMLDDEKSGFTGFCQALDIPEVYTSSQNLVDRYCFSQEDPNSIYSNLLRAYDNAICLRDEIGSEVLAFVQLAIYEFQKAKESEAPLIYLQRVNDNILAFWGIADDQIGNEQIRSIIKAGKRIERLDLYARLGHNAEEIRKEASRLVGRLKKTSLDYDEEKLEKLHVVSQEESVDLAEVLRLVDTILPE